MKRARCLVSLVFLHLTICSVMIGQGIIKGTVRDSLERQPLVGANVYLAGTAMGAASDVDGKYVIARIPPGRYDLRVSYLGYLSKTIPVSVDNNVTIELDVNLLVDAIQGEGIVLTARL